MSCWCSITPSKEGGFAVVIPQALDYMMTTAENKWTICIPATIGHTLGKLMVARGRPRPPHLSQAEWEDCQRNLFDLIVIYKGIFAMWRDHPRFWMYYETSS